MIEASGAACQRRQQWHPPRQSERRGLSPPNRDAALIDGHEGKSLPTSSGINPEARCTTHVAISLAPRADACRGFHPSGSAVRLGSRSDWRLKMLEVAGNLVVREHVEIVSGGEYESTFFARDEIELAVGRHQRGVDSAGVGNPVTLDHLAVRGVDTDSQPPGVDVVDFTFVEAPAKECSSRRRPSRSRGCR